MKLIHRIAATLATSTVLVAISACGGGGMDMPPPASGTTLNNAEQPSQVDPNLHTTLPTPSASADPSTQNGGMAGMPGMSPAVPPPSSTSMRAMKPTSPMAGMSKSTAGKQGGMGTMDAGMPMDGGMRMGCCGGPPMPKPLSPAPMPMTTEHGDGHM